MKQYKVQKVKLADITPAAYNPRKMSKHQRAALKASIQAYGLTEPLILNGWTLVGGHQRLEILKELKIESVDAIIINVTPAEEKQLNIALNKIGGEWDKKKLRELLKDLLQSDHDFITTGFSSEEVADLIKAPQLELTDGGAPDAPPPSIPVQLSTNHIRMIQLVFERPQAEHFQRLVQGAAKKYETSNVTDTVFKAVMDAASRS